MLSRLRLASNSETKFKIFSIILAILLIISIVVIVFLYVQYEKALEESTSLKAYRDKYFQIEEFINLRTPLAKENLADLIVVNDKIKNTIIDLYSGNFKNDIFALTKWVHTNIKYVNDPPYPRIFAGNISFVNDVWQSSIETLQLRQGDCEDLAALLAAFIKSVYPTSEVYVIVVGSSESFGHAASLVFYEDVGYLLDPTFGTIYELEDGIYEWLNNISAPQSAYVSFIVGLNTNNEKVYLEFSSTYQFILWFRKHKTL